MTGDPRKRYGDPSHAMLLIKSLDVGASLKLSEWTGQWYIEAGVEVSNGVILSGGTEHRDTPEEAIYAYLDMLTSIPLDSTLVTRAYHPGRRHWRWNGAAFAEEPQPERSVTA